MRIYAGVAARELWMRQERIRAEISRDFPTSPWTYVIGFPDKNKMGYYQGQLLFLGALECLSHLNDGIVVERFPEGHEFYNLDESAQIDSKTRDLLIQRFGEDAVRL